MTCKWKVFCKQGDTCVAHEGYGILKCTAFKEKGAITNEEWLKSLSTEELAEFLADKCNEVVDTVLYDASCNIDYVDQDDYWYRKTDFVEWLKEIHKDS
jgi:hypothetical protein